MERTFGKHHFHVHSKRRGAGKDWFLEMVSACDETTRFWINAKILKVVPISSKTSDVTASWEYVYLLIHDNNFIELDEPTESVRIVEFLRTLNP